MEGMSLYLHVLEMEMTGTQHHGRVFKIYKTKTLLLLLSGSLKSEGQLLHFMHLH